MATQTTDSGVAFNANAGFTQQGPWLQQDHELQHTPLATAQTVDADLASSSNRGFGQPHGLQWQHRQQASK